MERTDSAEAVASREPSDYAETDHFSDAYDDPLRFVTPETVEQTVIRGRDHPHEGGPGKIRRKLEYDGVDTVVVIALDAPVLVTAWTEVRDWKRALASESWTFDQLEKMRVFMDREHKGKRW